MRDVDDIRMDPLEGEHFMDTRGRRCQVVDVVDELDPWPRLVRYRVHDGQQAERHLVTATARNFAGLVLASIKGEPC